jgi:hypothetical protein
MEKDVSQTPTQELCHIDLPAQAAMNHELVRETDGLSTVLRQEICRARQIACRTQFLATKGRELGREI